MSGIEIFGVITGAIALTETLLKLYKAIETRNDLPEAFLEVGKRLPLVEEILELAKGLTDGLEEEHQETQALKQNLDDCHSKLSQLHEIFRQISKGDAKEKSLVDVYQKVIRKLKLDNKSGRVEALMKGTLDSLQLLTMHRAFKDAMKTQAAHVSQAKEELEKVAEEMPSLPDLPEGTRGDNVNYGEINRQFANWGEQTNIEGGQWNIAGAYIHGDQVLGDMNINTYNQSTYVYSERQSYYGLPHISVSHVVERVQVQNAIETKFSGAISDSNKPAVLVLHGIGGLGKSLIALNYCRSKHALMNYQDVFWVDASSKTTTVQGFKKMASMLSGTDKVVHMGHITHEMMTSVISQWSSRWLLVFDNYNPSDGFNIQAFFPESKEGRILITTRETELECLGWESIGIPTMTKEEALDLFLHWRHRTVNNLSRDASSACTDLFEMLGNLPIAIDHVAQALPGQDLTSEIHEYMKMFNQHRTIVEKTMHVDGLMLNWYTTYECSILELPRPIAKASVQILTLSAFLGGTTIHGAFFQRYASTIDDNSWLWIRLLRTTEGTKRFREMVLALSRMVDMDNPIILDLASFYRRCSRLEDAKRLQRGLLMQRREAGIKDDNPASTNLQLELGQSLRDNSEIQAAMKCYEALRENEDKFDSVQYCQMLIGLADVNDLLMRHKEARRQLAIAVKFFEEEEQPGRIFAEKERRTDSDATNQRVSFPPLSASQKLRHWRLLVKALIIRGRLESNTGHTLLAHQVLIKAREIGERFCENDNLTLEAKMSLANTILISQRQPGKAMELAMEVMGESVEWNGPDHRITLGALTYIGMIWGKTGHYSLARNCFQTVKEHAKNLFGETAGDVLNELVIGDTYAAEGNYTNAEEQYLFAKKKSEKLAEPIMERAVCMTRRLTTNQKIVGSIPIMINFLFACGR
ncbi:hypothetical protein CEP53_009210 [Fusarium sp. AF-6]|nr:hypothetical protein CEP53_009210 [Fusarium sp. AF-6]